MRFGCFRCLSILSAEQIQVAAANLVSSYPDDLDNSFADELQQFAKFANIFNDEEPDDISTEMFLYKLILGKRVQDTFPNVEIALRMYLVLMITNCSGERSFSKLKLIQNRLRTSMTQGRLNDLTIMSIESDVMRSVDFESTIADFALRKSRKVHGI